MSHDIENELSWLADDGSLVQRAGGMMDRESVAAYLAISPEIVAAMARRGEPVTLPQGERDFHPAFQFQGCRVIPGIRELLEVLLLTDGWSQTAFLLTPDPGLDDRTPIEAFGKDRETVMALAASMDTQGAS